MEYELTDQEVREDQADCQRQAIGTPKGGLCDAAICAPRRIRYSPGATWKLTAAINATVACERSRHPSLRGRDDIVAIIFILAGLAAIVTEWVLRYRQAQRRNKRMYKHGRLYSTRELD